MRILHLEDDGPLRDILKIALTSARPNIELKQFINSDYALEYAKEHINEIDLYVLDIRVPGSINGVEFAKKIRELGSTQRIVITSAYRRPDKTELQDMGVEWMAKPWHLLDAPEKLLGMGAMPTPPPTTTTPKPSASTNPPPPPKPPTPKSATPTAPSSTDPPTSPTPPTPTPKSPDKPRTVAPPPRPINRPKPLTSVPKTPPTPPKNDNDPPTLMATPKPVKTPTSTS